MLFIETLIFSDTKVLYLLPEPTQTAVACKRQQEHLTQELQIRLQVFIGVPAETYVVTFQVLNLENTESKQWRITLRSGSRLEI